MQSQLSGVIAARSHGVALGVSRLTRGVSALIDKLRSILRGLLKDYGIIVILHLQLKVLLLPLLLNHHDLMLC